MTASLASNAPSKTLPRTAGILLHPTSLPSRGGIGDLGPAAYQFLEFLVQAKQGLWQVLPLGPGGGASNPYSAISAFAGEPALISAERLVEHGWLAAERLAALPAEVTSHVQYDVVRDVKLPLLREAAGNFLTAIAGDARSAADAKQRFASFCANAFWLEDYALFEALRNRHQQACWCDWPEDLAHRKPAALEQARRELADDISIVRVLQFFFFEQWSALRQACNARGVRLAGDIAIFVNYDSADVWANPEIFRLDKNLAMEVISGVPPDAFTEDGQRWGHPLYRWDVLKERGPHGYDWWVQRVRWAASLCDYIRLDHFRGFAQFWEIPAEDKTAKNGKWVDGPGADLFHAIRLELGELPFFAEDLGVITPDVEELRNGLGLPGMKVLQFGFGDAGSHQYLPHRYVENCIVYTGTHDNDTVAGWWQNGISEWDRPHVQALLGEPEDGIPWAMIRAAQASVAMLAVAPIQDVLGLGSEARMNVPGVAEGNFQWRLQPGMLQWEHVQKLAQLAEVTDRLPQALSARPTEEYCA